LTNHRPRRRVHRIGNVKYITPRGLDALLYIARFRLLDGGRGQDSSIVKNVILVISCGITLYAGYKLNNLRLCTQKKWIKTVKLLGFLTDWKMRVFSPLHWYRWWEYVVTLLLFWHLVERCTLQNNSVKKNSGIIFMCLDGKT